MGGPFAARVPRYRPPSARHGHGPDRSRPRDSGGALRYGRGPTAGRRMSAVCMRCARDSAGTLSGLAAARGNMAFCRGFRDFADVAQLVEHFTRNEGVPGSSPGVGSSGKPRSQGGVFSLPRRLAQRPPTCDDDSDNAPPRCATGPTRPPRNPCPRASQARRTPATAAKRAERETRLRLSCPAEPSGVCRCPSRNRTRHFASCSSKTASRSRSSAAWACGSTSRPPRRRPRRRSRSASRPSMG